MRTKAFFPVLVLILLPVLLIACRREPDPTPTIAPTSVVVQSTATAPVAATEPPPTSTPPQPTAEAVIEPIRMDPDDIDWAPQVVAASPGPGQESRLDGAITIRFDQAMDPDSVESAFVVEDAQSEAPIEGVFQWPEPHTLIFTPQSSLQRDQRYDVQIGESARSENGQSLEEGIQFTFETVGFLEVAEVIPGDNVDDVDPQNGITVIFNRPVVPLVSTSQQSNLPQPLELNPPVEGEGQWVSTSIYRFVPETGFAAASSYEVRIAAGLEDITGGVLQEDFVWSFSTAQPSVAAILPGNGASDIIPTEPLTVTFNVRMDQDSVENAITLSPDHAVSFDWQEDGRTVVLQPQGNLQPGTEYTLTVSESAMVASGDATLDRETSSTFRMVPLPAVLMTSPSEGEMAPPYQFGISIEFASPMDPDTIEGRIRISPAPDGDVDEFISPQGRFVSLSFEMARNSGYTVTIPGDVADPYGNTLGSDYSWSFTTSPMAPLASLNVPAFVTQFSDDFPTTVTLLERNVNRIDVALYDAGLPMTYLVEPGRINEFSAEGTALRTWSFAPTSALDEVGEIELDLSGTNDALPTGVYFLDVNSPAIDESLRWWQNQRVFAIVAGTNLVVKETFGGVHVWATDLADGAPVSNLSLRLFDGDGLEVATATTDNSGLATFNYTPAENFLRGVVVMGSTPGDARFGVGSTNWNEGVAPWAFDLPYMTQDEQPEFAYIHTDRPIYRPGDTVHFRGILREANYGRYNLPQRDTVLVQVEFASFFDPQQGTEFETEVAVSAAGTFQGEYTIPENAPLGQYRLYLGEDPPIADGMRFFTVADYRNPEFTVTVTPQEEELLRGETVDVTIEARYFFGAPAPELPVTWTVYQRPSTLPWDGPFFSFTDDDSFSFFGEGSAEGFFGEYVIDGSGQTDANGQLVVSLPADLLQDVEDGSRLVTVEALIRDLSEFPVSASGQVVFHAAEIYVGVAPDDYLNTAGSEVDVNLLTVDWDGEAVANQDVEVVFYERDYTYVRDRQRGAGFGRWEAEDTEVARTEVTTDGSGEARATFSPEDGGTYRAVATVTDGAGRTQSSSALLWVSDADFVMWRTNPDEKRMDMTPDQRTYELGDTARILVQSPFEGPVQAWLTIERGTVMEQRLVTLEGNSEVIEIPISEALSPNVFVSLVAVQGAEISAGQYADIRLGITELVVPPDSLSLNVELMARNDILAPGENVTYEIRVTNHAGQPVQAEVSLALVDLAVLTLQEDNAPAIVDAFYSRQPYRSKTGSGLFVTGEGLSTNIPQEQLGLGGGGGGGDFQQVSRALGEDDDVRRDFPDTAYWRADLVTGADGTATVEIPLPDSVTTWRLSSKAVSEDSLVGQNSVDVVATLPLLLRPVTPRFMTVNDEVVLGAIVNNNSDQSLDANVTLEANGVTIQDDVVQTVTVAANSQQLVRWWVTVDDVTFADLTFRVEGGGFADATKPTFGVGPEQLVPVYRFDAEDLVGTSGVLEEAGQRVEAILVQPQVDVREGEVVVSLTPSLAGALIDSLEALDGEELLDSSCAPGIVSHFLPNLMTVRALRQLGIDQPELGTELDNLVQEAINRLATLQMADGGWGWCYANSSDAYLTAYVLFGVAKAQEAGFDVSSIAINRALSRLDIRNPQPFTEPSEANRQAFFLYVRAELGEGSVDQLDALFDAQRDALDPYAHAYLALAYEVLGEHGHENQETLMADLVNDAILSATGAHWEDAERDWFNLNSDIRGTAVVLDALARIEPENGIATQVVRWLMAARTANVWPTTFETAWSIVALTDWMAASGELDADFDYQFSLNGSEMATGTFEQENVTEVVDVTVPMGALMPDEANFLMFDRGEGQGRMYYTAHLDAFVDAQSVEAVSRGITVQRAYFDAECDPEEFSCEPLDSVEAGQRVRVELTLIAPNDLVYLRLEDPIPAGAEAVDPGLLTSASDSGGGFERIDNEQDYRFGYWGWWYFNNIEYRDEMVVFNSSFLPAGTYQYSYILETPIPGEFQVRPAIAYEEFFPEVFGRSDGARFIIEE